MQRILHLNDSLLTLISYLSEFIRTLHTYLTEHCKHQGCRAHHRCRACHKLNIRSRGAYPRISAHIAPYARNNAYPYAPKHGGKKLTVYPGSPCKLVNEFHHRAENSRCRKHHSDDECKRHNHRHLRNAFPKQRCRYNSHKRNSANTNNLSHTLRNQKWILQDQRGCLSHAL